MAEREWNPKIGDKVYCVCEYYTSDYTMRYKGLEGFRNYGLEVVESIVKSPYKWKSGGLGCVSVCLHREVGDNANNLFYWKKSDLGTRLFSTREEAAAVADVRAHNMDLGMWGKKYENRPMYKNWLHWEKPEMRKNGAEATKTPENGAKTRERTKRKSKQVFKRKAELPEEIYTQWRDGKLTTAEGAKIIGVAAVTFEKYAYEQIKARGEKHTGYSGNRKKLEIENFEENYQKWRDGKLSGVDAAERCKVSQATFTKYANEQLKARGESKKSSPHCPLPDNFYEIFAKVDSGRIPIAEGARQCDMPYRRFLYQVERVRNEKKK